VKEINETIRGSSDFLSPLAGPESLVLKSVPPCPLHLDKPPGCRLGKDRLCRSYQLPEPSSTEAFYWGLKTTVANGGSLTQIDAGRP
jgi:hypothetical protein